MNILHLKYVLEVERTNSFTKAAENLFISQPNLSRSIKEIEENLGYNIFRRTSKGIILTREGEEFILHANKIINEYDKIESIGRFIKDENQTFSISVPRDYNIYSVFSKFVDKLDINKKIEIDYRETNSMRILNNVLERNYNLAILRYQEIYEDFYLNFFREKDLKSKIITCLEHKLIMSKNNPLSNIKKIFLKDLDFYIELIFGDPYVPTISYSQLKQTEFTNQKKYILLYERSTQLDLLSSNFNTFMWSTPLPEKILVEKNLILSSCSDETRKYKYVLIYKKNYHLTELDNKFIEELNSSFN